MRTPPTTASTRKRKADEIDNKMSALLDKYISNSDERNTSFGQFIDSKMAVLPIEDRERLEAQIVSLVYAAVEKHRATSRNAE